MVGEKMKKLFLVLVFLLIPSLVFGARLHPEKYYQTNWCTNDNAPGTSLFGVEIEYVLKDKTRVDCLTTGYAIEFDFADKWAESIGQALHYAHQTQRKAGIVLIVENAERDLKYVLRLYAIVSNYNIPVKIWVTRP